MPDGIQLPLPAGWARDFLEREDPADQLRRLERDTLDAKASIRAVLDDLAAQHRIRIREINHAMDYVDDALSNLAYELRAELTAEIERRDHLED